MWESNLKKYDQLVDLCQGIERKGKTVPYTSDNGYMFSLLNKDAELGIRLPKASAEKFKEDYASGIFKSHGAIMKDYVLIPDQLLNDLGRLVPFLKESHAYVLSLKPKPSKKK